MNLAQKVQELKEIKEREEALRQAKAEAGRTREALEAEICEHFRDNMQTRVDVNGMIVKAELKPVFTIKGGKLKAPEQREQVVNYLESLGFLDSDKVVRYQGVEVPDNSLQAAFRRLSIEQITDLQRRGLVSIYDKPSVTIK